MEYINKELQSLLESGELIAGEHDAAHSLKKSKLMSESELTFVKSCNQKVFKRFVIEKEAKNCDKS